MQAGLLRSLLVGFCLPSSVCLEPEKNVRYVVEDSLPSSATLIYRDSDEHIEIQGPIVPWEYEFQGESGQQIFLEVTTRPSAGGTAYLEIYIDRELFKSASNNGFGNVFINENIL